MRLVSIFIGEGLLLVSSSLLLQSSTPSRSCLHLTIPSMLTSRQRVLSALTLGVLTVASAALPRWVPIGDAPNAFLTADKALAQSLALGASSPLGIRQLITSLTPETSQQLFGVTITPDWATDPYKNGLLADGVTSFLTAYTPLALLAWLRGLPNAPAWAHSGALARPQAQGATAYGNAPNWDTVYSLSWVELAQGAYELSVPPVPAGRFFSASVVDVYQNVVAKFGTIDGAVDGYRALLLGPTTPRNAVDAWKTAVHSEPTPTRVVEVPVDGVFVILRIGLDLTNPNDHAQNVAPLQAQFALRPWKFTPNPAITYPKYPQSLANAGTSGADFFTAGSAVLNEFIPSPSYLDGRPALALHRFGLLEPSFNFSKLDNDSQTALSVAAPLGHLLLDAGLLSLFDYKYSNNWGTSISYARYGADHFLNAVVAKYLPIPNAAEESIYPVTFWDADGAPLTGANGTKYTITFPAPLPYDPSKGWWSLIPYNKQGALIANPINRQAINDRTQNLTVNEDGSFTVYLQAEPPTDEAEAANWLPVHADAFWLALRLYKPTPDALDGRWAPPNVTRVVPSSGTPSAGSGSRKLLL